MDRERDINIKINPELVTAAKIAQVFPGTFTSKKLVTFNRMQRFLRFKPQIKGLETTEIYLKEGRTKVHPTPLRLLVFRPARNNPESEVLALPCMVWFHGGGYALGGPESAARIAKLLNQVQPCIVIAPEYTLSLQAPYPAAVKDAYKALLWVKDHAAYLGIDSERIYVGGDSAGGGLSAGLCLLARDMAQVNIAFQMPLYPMLDDRMITPSSIDNNAPVWNSTSNRNAWQLYLGKLYQSPAVPIYAAPSRGKYFANLPPVCSFVGDLEPFRDEVIDYMDALKRVGVPTTFQCFEGCYHAFEQMQPHTDVSQAAIRLIKDAFSDAVKAYRAPQPVLCEGADYHQEVLLRIARALNAHQIVWGIGGSTLLKYHGILSFARDIDLVIAIEDIPLTVAILETIGESIEALEDNNCNSDYFYQFSVGGIHVDLMGGLKVENDSESYQFDFDAKAIERFLRIDAVEIPLTSLESWLKVYALMPNREEKVAMIRRHLGEISPMIK